MSRSTGNISIGESFTSQEAEQPSFLDSVAPRPIRHPAKMSVPSAGTQFGFLDTEGVPAFVGTHQPWGFFSQQNWPKTMLKREGTTPPATVQVTPMTMDSMPVGRAESIPVYDVNRGIELTSTQTNTSVLQDDVGTGAASPNQSAFLPNVYKSKSPSAQELWKRNKKVTNRPVNLIDAMADDIFCAPEGTFEVDNQSFETYFANMFDDSAGQYQTKLQHEESQGYRTEQLPGGDNDSFTAERIIKESVPISYSHEEPYDPLVSIVVLGIEKITGIKIPKRDISNYYNEYGGLDLNTKNVWKFRTSHVFGIKSGMASQLKLANRDAFLHKYIGNEQIHTLATLFLVAEAPLCLRSAASKYTESIKKVVNVNPNDFSWESEKVFQLFTAGMTVAVKIFLEQFSYLMRLGQEDKDYLDDFFVGSSVTRPHIARRYERSEPLFFPDMSPPDGLTHCHGRWIWEKGQTYPTFQFYDPSKGTIWDLPPNVSEDSRHWVGRRLPTEQVIHDMAMVREAI